MIKLDGKNGGGQILRTALSLSMLTGQGFRMKNIRGLRKKPGLMRQHLTCVQAAADVSGASVDGAELGSAELIFKPGGIVAGDFHFRIGTAGSTVLLAQTLIPALLRAENTSTLILEGGTHNPMAPSACYLEHVFLPQLKRMGAEVKMELKRHGFAPAGGGVLELEIQPCAKLKPLHLLEHGAEVSRSIVSHLAHVKETVAQREFAVLLNRLKWEPDCARVVDASDSSGSGNCLSVMVQYENVAEMVLSHGTHGVRAERVASNAGGQMYAYLSSGAVVGERLADQLLLPMALAGAGSMLIAAPSNHLLTNIEVIEMFLGDTIKVSLSEQGSLYKVNIESEFPE